MATRYYEKDLRDWVNARIGSLISLVENLQVVEESITERRHTFRSSTFGTVQDIVAGAIQDALDQRVLYCLTALKDGAPLFSLGTEVPMINSPLRGKKPSADILAKQTMSGGYVVVEVKISPGTSREAVTELSAYANGLGQRYWGLSSYDSIWLLISTDYRPTLSAAIAYQQLVAGRCIIPLRATVSAHRKKITGVRFNVVDMAVAPDPFLGDALFCDHVYDCVAPHFAEPTRSPEVAMHFLSSGFERTGASGFCFTLVPNQHERRLPYPYGLAAVTLNPFKLHLKALKLTELVKRGVLQRGTDEYQREVLDEVFQVSVDADIATFDSVFINEAEQDESEPAPSSVDPERSLRELADRELSSQTLAFSAVLEELLIQPGDSVEMHAPGLDDCLSPSSGTPLFNENNVALVRYFGVIHDIMARCAEYVLLHDADFAGKAVSEVYESSRLLLKMFRKIPLRIK